jgi:hypothetical protein
MGLAYVLIQHERLTYKERPCNVFQNNVNVYVYSLLTLNDATQPIYNLLAYFEFSVKTVIYAFTHFTVIIRQFN